MPKKHKYKKPELLKFKGKVKLPCDRTGKFLDNTENTEISLIVWRKENGKH